MKLDYLHKILIAICIICIVVILVLSVSHQRVKKCDLFKFSNIGGNLNVSDVSDVSNDVSNDSLNQIQVEQVKSEDDLQLH